MEAPTWNHQKARRAWPAKCVQKLTVTASSLSILLVSFQAIIHHGTKRTGKVQRIRRRLEAARDKLDD